MGSRVLIMLRLLCAWGLTASLDGTHCLEREVPECSVSRPRAEPEAIHLILLLGPLELSLCVALCAQPYQREEKGQGSSSIYGALLGARL